MELSRKEKIEKLTKLKYRETHGGNHFFSQTNSHTTITLKIYEDLKFFEMITEFKGQDYSCSIPIEWLLELYDILKRPTKCRWSIECNRCQSKDMSWNGNSCWDDVVDKTKEYKEARQW